MTWLRRLFGGDPAPVRAVVTWRESVPSDRRKRLDDDLAAFLRGERAVLHVDPLAAVAFLPAAPAPKRDDAPTVGELGL
jgi:hypothetical protein